MNSGPNDVAEVLCLCCCDPADLPTSNLLLDRLAPTEDGEPGRSPARSRPAGFLEGWTGAAWGRGRPRH